MSLQTIWTAALVALVYGILIYAFRDIILPLVGADQATYGFCCEYASWVITVGAVPTVLSAAFAHLVRAEGYSRQASFGMAFGGILNIILEDYEIKNLNQRNPGKSRVWRLGSVSLTSTDAA